MDTKTILAYLSDLEQNNDREWYHANKTRYREAIGVFGELVELLNTRISQMDGSIPLCDPKDLMFKIVRDTRFSHDKSPYNPAFRAHIGPSGKSPIPVGYYINVQPGDRSFLGGGLFADMFKDATAMIRDHIVEHGGEWDEIINGKGFSDLFTVRGTRLKNVPRGYDAAHPQAEYLKNKSWYLEYPVPDAMLLDAGIFVESAAGVFARMKPFNDYLNTALRGFEMPSR